MGSLDNTPGTSVGVAAGWSELPKEEVLAELERVLASHQFRTSKKCSRFLGHIIQAALEGRFDRLKERTLGIDVFGREPHYDTNQDPIVRGTAGEVRKRLAQYYLKPGPANFGSVCRLVPMCRRPTISGQSGRLARWCCCSDVRKLRAKAGGRSWPRPSASCARWQRRGCGCCCVRPRSIGFGSPS